VNSLVNKATQHVFEANGFEALSATVGVVLIVLLIVLLVEREVLRALGGPRAVARVRSLTVATLPLLIAAVAIIGTRIESLLN
jgi:hypothetical protein